MRLKKKGARGKQQAQTQEQQQPAEQPGSLNQTSLPALPLCNTSAAIVTILEPPPASTINGDAFNVRLDVSPCNSEVFKEEYNEKDSRVCVGLDESPL